MTFSDLDGNGVIDENSEILQTQQYYPFGMVHNGLQTPQVSAKNHYQYNDKELNDDFGLDWLDYGARFYDASMGRWSAVDPLAEKYYSFSPYNYVVNNPLIFIDPDGRYVEDPDGNIVFVTKKKRKWFWHGKAKKNDGKREWEGIGYYGVEGNIILNNGKISEVSLVKTEGTTVYEGKERQLLDGTYETETTGVVEDKDASTNCTGDCFFDGKLTIYSEEITADYLEIEGYIEVNEEIQKGDIGLYYKNEKIAHAEKYIDKDTVDSKGGINKKEYHKKPQTTWNKEYDNYKVIRKRENVKNVVSDISSKYGKVKNGIRYVNTKQAKKIIKSLNI